MTADREELAAKWDAAAARVAAVLTAGEDACFLTLGDPLLYSTYIYLLRALRKRLPDLKAVTVPGITAFGAAAALAEFPVGEGREPVTIVPAADDLTAVRRALAAGRHRRPDEDREAPPGGPRPPRRRGAPGEERLRLPRDDGGRSGSRPTSAA